MSKIAPPAATTTQTPKPAAAAPAKPKAAPAPLLVLDTTAVDGPRTHQMGVNGVTKNFTFEVGKPLPLPVPIALKFLKHEAFWLVDEKGQKQDFQRRPKQPEELGAGEVFKLAENETVARYDELAMDALMHRVIEMPNGEQFAGKPPNRKAMIEFIKKTVAENKKANTVNDREGVMPAALIDDEGFDDDEAEAA